MSAQSLESSQFWFIEVESLKNSNPDSLGIIILLKFYEKIKKPSFDDISGPRFSRRVAKNT